MHRGETRLNNKRKSKTTKSTSSLLQKLQRNGVPSSIINSFCSIDHEDPSQLRNLTFQKIVSCKSMSLLARMQNVQTLKMSLDQPLKLKRRDTQMTRDCEMQMEEQRENDLQLRVNMGQMRDESYEQAKMIEE